eukprot:6586464-Prymnesium_polylepis.4
MWPPGSPGLRAPAGASLAPAGIGFAPSQQSPRSRAARRWQRRGRRASSRASACRRRSRRRPAAMCKSGRPHRRAAAVREANSRGPWLNARVAARAKARELEPHTAYLLLRERALVRGVEREERRQQRLLARRKIAHALVDHQLDESRRVDRSRGRRRVGRGERRAQTL